MKSFLVQAAGFILFGLGIANAFAILLQDSATPVTIIMEIIFAAAWLWGALWLIRKGQDMYARARDYRTACKCAAIMAHDLAALPLTVDERRVRAGLSPIKDE